MEPRDLEYFAVIAEHGNLRRAAEALNMSQPALSKSLRRLETWARGKLVKRTPAGVDLTPMGSALLFHARRFRLYLDDVTRELAGFADGRAGNLRVGADAYSADHLIPQACAAFCSLVPLAKLKVVIDTN